MNIMKNKKVSNSLLKDTSFLRSKNDSFLILIDLVTLGRVCSDKEHQRIIIHFALDFGQNFRNGVKRIPIDGGKSQHDSIRIAHLFQILKTSRRR